MYGAHLWRAVDYHGLSFIYLADAKSEVLTLHAFYQSMHSQAIDPMTLVNGNVFTLIHTSIHLEKCSRLGILILTNVQHVRVNFKSITFNQM